MKRLLVCIGLLFSWQVMISSPAQLNAQVQTYKEYGNVYEYRFDAPEDIYVDQSGIVYMTDANNHAVKAFTQDGKNVFSIDNGQGVGAAQFNYPTAVTKDSKGKVWLVDRNNDRLQRFSDSGDYDQVLPLQYGSAWNRRLDNPDDIAIGPQGNYWIADYNKYRIVAITPEGKQVLSMEHVDENGYYQSGDDPGYFNGPTSLAFDSQGNLWVADHNNGRIQKFDSQGDYLQSLNSEGSLYSSGLHTPAYLQLVSDGILVSHGHVLTKFSLTGLEIFSLGKEDGSGSGRQ